MTASHILTAVQINASSHKVAKAFAKSMSFCLIFHSFMVGYYRYRGTLQDGHTLLFDDWKSALGMDKNSVLCL